jgi:hypothetical protein
MIWRMRKAMVAIALVIGCAPIRTAAATPGGVGIALAWKGEQPTEVMLGNIYPPTTLTLNPAKTAFEIQYAPPRATTYLSSMSLDAAYGDGATLSLPIRVWPDLPGLTTTVYQMKYTACSPSDLQGAERAAGSVQGALKAFFTARALYVLEGDDQCSPRLKQRAAKAWFDRAYELTTLANYFDLSREAAAAYSNYDAAYVKHYQDEAQGAALKLINDAKKSALKGGDFDAAGSLNTSLLNAVTGDPAVRAIGRRLQGLTEDQLKLDADHIAGRAVSAGVSLSSPAVNLELAPKALSTAEGPSS